MKNRNTYSYSLGFLLFTMLIACSGSKKHSIDLSDDITIITANDPDKNIKIEDIYDSLEMIPLETKEECLIGYIHKVERFEDRIYILDANGMTLGLFDTDGKYISHINKPGRGPDEYLSINFFRVDPISRKILLSDNFSRKIFIYDLDLNHEKTISVDFHPAEIPAYRNNLLLQGQPTPVDRMTNEILRKFESSLIDTLGHIVQGMIAAEIQNEHSLFTAMNVTAHDGGSILMQPMMSDIIYRITESFDSVIPAYYLNFQMKNWRQMDYDFYADLHKNVLETYQEVKKYEKENKTLITGGLLLNTDSNILVRYGNAQPIVCIYNKKTENAISYSVNDIKGHEGLKIITACVSSAYKDKLYSGIPVINAKQIADLEDLQFALSDSIRRMDDNANPVIFSYKIKEGL